MAVTVNATGTAVHLTATTSLSYSGLTIGAITNTVAVFSVCCGITSGTGSVTFTSPAWNGVACTQIATITDTTTNSQVVLFGIVNPATGAHNFTATASTSVDYYAYGVAFNGANQTGGTTTFANATTAQSSGNTAIPIAVTTANGNYTFCTCSVGTGNSTSTLTNSLSVAEDWVLSTLTSGVFGAGGKAASTGATTTWTGNNSASDFGCIAGVDIVAASTGDTLGNPMQLMFI